MLVLHTQQEVKHRRRFFYWSEAEKEWKYDIARPKKPTPGLTPLINSAIVPFVDALYAVGGIQVTTTGEEQHIQVLPTIQFFDRKNLEWKVSEIKLSEGRNQPAAIIRGRKLFVIGGKNSDGVPMSTMEAFQLSYDLKPQMFRLNGLEPGAFMNELKEARSGHACVLWKDTVCVVGGYGEARMGQEEILQSLELLDPRSNEWSLQDKKMKTVRSRFAVAVLGDKLYVIGGSHRRKIPRRRTNTSISLNSVECYDFVKKEWKDVNPMKYRRQNPKATVWKGRIFVFGGDTYQDKNANRVSDSYLHDISETKDPSFTDCQEVESFDPENGEWVEERDYALPTYIDRDREFAISPEFAGAWF